MGNPARYSIEVPLRCFRLLEDYWKSICSKDYPQFQGPLATTFLVAMAGPIINFPYERIVREDNPQNERHLSYKLADQIDTALHINHFRDAPFFAEGIWRYCHVPARSDFTVTAMPHDILETFETAEASSAAENVHTHTWFSAMRHSLAHSAITYLDANGRQDAGSPAQFIVFVSEHRRKRQLQGYHMFRITRDDLRSFLGTWIEWLLN